MVGCSDRPCIFPPLTDWGVLWDVLPGSAAAPSSSRLPMMACDGWDLRLTKECRFPHQTDPWLIASAGQGG